VGEWAGNLDALLGRQVVLDLAGPLLYLGTLAAVRGDCLELTDADVHDTREGHHSKEQYVAEACKLGVRPNRRRVLVIGRDVVSISLLSDVVAD
jgi:hypothetical protein